MSEAGSTNAQNPNDGAPASVDHGVFLKLLKLASAAFVYRQQMQDYLATQIALAESGATIETLMETNWELFEHVANAEDRLFAAVDDLGDLPA